METPPFRTVITLPLRRVSTGSFTSSPVSVKAEVQEHEASLRLFAKNGCTLEWCDVNIPIHPMSQPIQGRELGGQATHLLSSGLTTLNNHRRLKMQSEGRMIVEEETERNRTGCDWCIQRCNR